MLPCKTHLDTYFCNLLYRACFVGGLGLGDHSEGGDALNRLPKEAVDAPSLQAFQVRMDVALGSMGCWLATLHIAGGWNSMSIVVLSNPGHSMVL